MPTEDAVAYSYANVGVDLVPSRQGIAYSMWNLGGPGLRSVVGRVVNFSTSNRIAFAALYANIGFFFEDVRDAVATVMWNQLDYSAGGPRTLEDGADRHLEDGTATRSLEG